MLEINGKQEETEAEELEQKTTDEYVKKANKSFKWSTAAEVFAKLVSPISNMILARFIAPEIFGIVASISVIISFAQILAEGGFGRYLVLKETNDPKVIKRTFGTCFDSTMILSLLIYLPILIWRNQLATLVNCEGYGLYLALAALQIPFYGLMGVQSGLARRFFDYKRLAIVRAAVAVSKLAAQLTLALLGFGIEALIFGTIIGTIVEDIILTIWYRKWFSVKFSWTDFKEMWGVCLGFILESVSNWATTAIDTIMLAYFFDQTTTGLYKNGFTTVVSVITMITSVYSNILVSLLSRCKNDMTRFNQILCTYQKLIAYILIPLSVGIYLYRDFLTYVFFGEGWEGAAIVVGAVGLSYGFKISTASFVVTAVTSLGKPIWNMIACLLDTGCTLLAYLLFSNLGMETFIWIRCLSFLVSSVFLLSIAPIKIKLNPLLLLKNTLIPLCLSGIMFLAGFGLQRLNSDYWFSFLGVFICMALYFLLFFLFRRKDFKSLIKIAIGKPIEIN